MMEEKPPDPIDDRVSADLPESEPATRGFVAEAMRKAVLTGVGALFLTEEGARRLAREWKLPKELASYVVAQAQNAKDEVLRIVSQEVRRLFESEAFRQEVTKLIRSMAVEVKAEFRFKDASKDPPMERGRGGAARHRSPPAEESES